MRGFNGNYDESIVHIKRNSYGDTRTAPDDYSHDKFCDANREHADTVKRLMSHIASELFARADVHDFTKFSREEEFWRDFVRAKKDPDFKFTEGEWYKMHVNAERHHLHESGPIDVDILDIIEMICDNVAAGYARSGKVYDINIPITVLAVAINNTETKIKDMCVLDESDQEESK